MLIRRTKGWELPDSAATPEQTFLSRRTIVAGAAGMLTAGTLLAGTPAHAQRVSAMIDPTTDLYPRERSSRFVLDRDVTPEAVASEYNNFYEFGSSKRIARAAQALPIRPWTVTVDGLVAKPQVFDIDRLIRAMPLEERLYRLRCVEAWAMAVPWTGFPLKALLDQVEPHSGAKYVRFETFMNPQVASGQRQFWYPWPYVEGLAIDEAANDLTMLATGIYGKPLARQFGAPIRLVVPWKYGFKSIKSITRITLTAERPVSFWMKTQESEYGFWANVNPTVPHPRWSQASEELIGTNGRRVPTQMFNGYGEFVADLYRNRQTERLWA